MAPHISMIQRIDHRILKVTLGHPETHTPLTILATYAPHQGYTKHENTHWGNVRKTLKATPRNHMTIWGAGANGKLGRDTARPDQYNKIIGRFAKQENPEKGTEYDSHNNV